MTNTLILHEDAKNESHLTYVRDYQLPDNIADKGVQYAVYTCDVLGDEYEIGVLTHGDDLLFVQLDWLGGLQEPDEEFGFYRLVWDKGRVKKWQMHWRVFKKEDDGEWRCLDNAVVFSTPDGLPRLFNF